MVKYNIGLAVSRFYPKMADLLEKGALQTLGQFQKKNKILLKVKTGYTPGCSELPLMADHLFHKKCSAVICLGIVIQGQTSHYDSVCRLFEQGVMQVQLKWSKPCLCGVLMVKNVKQAQERLSGKNHQGKKSAQACLDILHCLSSVRSF